MDASNTSAKRFFFQQKKRILVELQKRIIKIWPRLSSQKAIMFIKDSTGEHITIARTFLRADIALQPKTYRIFWILYVNGTDKRAQKCSRAFVDIKFEFLR